MVGLFCATYLEQEMLHVHRHVLGLKSFRPVLVTQKKKGAWRGLEPTVVPRSCLREMGRFKEKLTGRPWQISRAEASRIDDIFSQARCVIAHVFFGDSAVHLLPWIETTSLPVVVSFHGSDVAGAMASDDYSKARGRLFSSTALVACRSEHLAGRVAELGCPQEKLRTMRAVLPEFPSSRNRTPPNDGAWRILQAGRMVPKKGMFLSLEAFAVFHKRYPASRLLIAGEGPLRSELEARVHDLGLGNAVEMPGFLDQPALEMAFAASHIYLHPSVTIDGDTEGVPNALLEAMAFGLPVVATRHGGITEAVEDGATGKLVPEGSSGDLASALLALADPQSNYSQISLAASESVRNTFGSSRAIDQIESIYREAAGMQVSPSRSMQ